MNSPIEDRTVVDWAAVGALLADERCEFMMNLCAQWGFDDVCLELAGVADVEGTTFPCELEGKARPAEWQAVEAHVAKWEALSDTLTATAAQVSRLTSEGEQIRKSIANRHTLAQRAAWRDAVATSTTDLGFAEWVAPFNAASDAPGSGCPCTECEAVRRG